MNQSTRGAGRPRSGRDGRSPRGSQSRGSFSRSTRGRDAGSRTPLAALFGRRWLLLAIPVLLTALVGALYFTPLLGVRSIQIVGARTLPEHDVRTALGVHTGQSMLRVDVDEVQSRLRAVPKVANVRVERAWPSTVRVELTERVPAAFTASGTGIQLIDAQGVPFETVPRPPAGLPELRVRSITPHDPVAASAMGVLAALPPAVRAKVQAVSAESSHDIRLSLSSGREVHWGGATQNQRKAAILPPLLTRPGKVYDVTSPALATVA